MERGHVVRALALILVGCSMQTGGSATDTCHRYERCMSEYASRCDFVFRTNLACDSVSVFDVDDIDQCERDMHARSCEIGPAPSSCKASMW